MRRVSAIALVLLFWVLPQANAETIWSDGFESGDFSLWTSAGPNWATSGGNTHSGAKRAQIVGSAQEDSSLVLANSLAGYKDIQLNYWYRIYDGLEVADFLYVEWTPNGADWQQLVFYNNLASSVDWHNASFDLPDLADNNPLFQLRLRANLSAGSDVVYFDDFQLSGALVPEPSCVWLFVCGFLAICAFGRKIATRT
mgnify:CR=1 FL=1